MRNSTQKNLIIDANNLLHRVFHVSKVLEKSTPTSHIYLFLNSLKSLVELFSPKKVICVWDYRKEDCYNFRKMLDSEYKAQRDEIKNKEVYEYMPVIMELLNSLGIIQINPINLEADDIIFWLAMKKYPNQSIVVSTDTDFYQLIGSDFPGNIIYNPKKKQSITELYLKDYYNVNNGFEYIILKALRGGRADNISGVKGIRSTRIQDIISLLKIDYDIDSLKDSSLLKEEELEIFKHNLKMMKFDYNLISTEEEEHYEKCISETPEANKENFTLLIKELEFWNIYRKIDYWYSTLANRLDITDVISSLFDFETE